MTEPAKPRAKNTGVRMKFPPEARGLVKGLVLANWDQLRISAHLGIDPKTLRKHFRAEIGDAPKGNKPMEFTDQQRGEVRGLAMANVPKDQIAKFVGIGEDSLDKYFAAEISKGRLTLLGGAATNMARMALGSRAEFDSAGNQTRAEVKPEFVACCYVLKSQGKDFGWGERFEHTGKNGEAIPVRLESLSDVQLAALIGRINTALGAIPAPG